jgi:hypothetical protein
MAADKLRYPIGETSFPQVTGAHSIVVDDAHRIMVHAFLLQEVTDVVQQGGEDHFLVGACVAGQLRALQRMFELRDRLAEIRRLAGRFKQPENLIHTSFGRDRHHRNILSEAH